MFQSTFKEEDCIFLLKDLTGTMEMTSFEEKERKISMGVNYAEMITKEEPVSDEINSVFKEILGEGRDMARLIEKLAGKIYAYSGDRTILVSLARAGSPIGALLKRYFLFKGYNIPHYSISIIRERGIDEGALDYIKDKHPFGKMIFVDGWTGKGSITKELIKSINEYNQSRHVNIKPYLAVVADPAHVATFSATREDICIPNACLNSTVTGLVSRTIYKFKEMDRDTGEVLISHGAVRFEELADYDLTNYFLDTISNEFSSNSPYWENDSTDYSLDEVNFSYADGVLTQLQEEYPLIDVSKIKLSIGESSRALIRRKPLIILINEWHHLTNNLDFIKKIAEEKQVPIKLFPQGKYGNYNCISLLK